MLAAYYVFAILGMDIFGGLLVREDMAKEARRLRCEGGGRELCKDAAAAYNNVTNVLRPDGTNAAEGVLTFPQVQMTAYGAFHYWDLNFNDLATSM